MIEHRATHVVRIGARKTPALPRPVDLRISRPRPVRTVRLPEEDAVALASGFRASVLARALSLFLVPLMLVYPLAPVFAEELAPPAEPASAPESAPPVPEASAPEATTPVVSDPAPVSLDASADPEVPSAESEEVPSESTAPTEGEIAGASAEDVVAPVSSDDVSPEVTAGEDEPPLDESDPLGGSTPEESEELPGSIDATTTDPMASSAGSEVGEGSDPDTAFASTTDSSAASASSTDVSIENGSASSTEATSGAAPDASVPPPAETLQNADAATLESAEDPAIRAARETAEREALKARLLEEVKAEFLSGCVTLERGGYYCLADDARAGATAPSVGGALMVSAGPDGKGSDKEIFLTGAESVIQLTDNAIEDAFPSKDLSGRSVVWQAEEGGRWQIMYADLSSSTPLVSAVTAGLESNFNPAVEGATVVWQGWADGNWEIFMAERDGAPDTIDQSDAARKVGATPGWRVTRITANGTHDMFPGIAGGMVTWQAFDGSAWDVYAYSRATGEIVRISAGEGSAERPRFAMLWEERDTDGRVRLMGYDMAKGERVDVTEEARAAGDGKRGPAMPSSPVSSPDQPALPLTSASSTTPVRPEGDASPDLLVP